MNVGIILFILGILFIVFGFFYRKKKKLVDPHTTIIVYTTCVLVGIVLLLNSVEYFLKMKTVSVEKSGNCKCINCEYTKECGENIWVIKM